METAKVGMEEEGIAKVLILPMRNGNHGEGGFHMFIVYNVLILPMRNGNPIRPASPYAPTPVLILPMRNGNGGLYIEEEMDTSVLILPMRNGNF